MPAQYGGGASHSWGQTTVTVTGSSAVFNDVNIFIVFQKEISGSGPITQSAGPTCIKLGEKLGTAGVGGTDTGPTRIAAFYRVVDGSESGNYSFTGSTDVMYAIPLFCTSSILQLGTWTIDAVFGEDTTAGAAVSATLGSIALQADDLCFAAMSVPTDVSADFTVEDIAATGMTFGAGAELTDVAESTGRDIGGFVSRQYISAGTLASVAPTVTSTVTGTTTNIYGPVVLVRARLTEIDGSQLDALYMYTNVGAADISDVILNAVDAQYIYANIGCAEVAGTRTLEGWGFGEDVSGQISEYYYAPGAATYLYANIFGAGSWVEAFTADDVFVPFVGNSYLQPETSVDVLLVGGGGSGARATRGGGGGGGGGVLYLPALAVTPGASISVQVGAGGAEQTLDAVGNTGGLSGFGAYAVAGGGGGGNRNVAGGSAATGGGGGGTDAAGTSVPGTGTPGVGYDGGLGLAINTTDAMMGGGGGGAGGVGGNTTGITTSGAGGAGYNASAVFGTLYGAAGLFGGGGSGGCRRTAAIPGAAGTGGGGRGADGFSGTAGTPGTPYTGGGGGGGGGETDLAGTTVGYAGGSGIVLIRRTIVLV